MKTSRSDLFTPNMERGTEQLRKKHRVDVEFIDHRGLMRRARVSDQTALDTLFLRRSITAPQHSAGESLLDVMVRSGGAPRSSDPSAVSFGTLRDAERAMSSKIMIASGAYRALAQAGPDVERVTIIVVSEINLPSAKLLPLIKRGLNALVRYFGTGSMRDPREAVDGSR
jgi:hypothetical protein